MAAAEAFCTAFLEGPTWADTTFGSDALPRRRLATPLWPRALGAACCLEYLTDALMVHRRAQDEQCRNSWAFALTGAVEHAVQLAYQRLGGVAFEGQHMSIEFLTSCYESPGRMCGCFGADLGVAVMAAAEGGLVTFRQAPYVATTGDQRPNSRDVDTAYYCGSTAQLGTCPPCAPSQADYVERVLPAGSADCGARFTVSCFPCNQPKTPRYYPHAPFHLFDSAWSQAERVASVKAELRRLGPLAAALPIDDEALLALLTPGESRRVQRPEDGLLYRPRKVRDGVYHCALIVGYIDVEAPPGDALHPHPRPAWLCRAAWPSAPGFGYTLELEGAGVVDRMFNVAMYDDPGATVADRVVSFEEVRVRVQPGGPLQELAISDPFVRVAAPLGAALRPDAQYDRRPVLIIAGLFAVCIGGAILILVLLRHFLSKAGLQ